MCLKYLGSDCKRKGYVRLFIKAFQIHNKNWDASNSRFFSQYEGSLENARVLAFNALIIFRSFANCTSVALLTACKD